MCANMRKILAGTEEEALKLRLWRTVLMVGSFSSIFLNQ